MNSSAAPWSGSLLIDAAQQSKSSSSFLSLCLWIPACFLLAACATTPIPKTSYPASYLESLAALENWNLRGRLNIRSGSESDTININWFQQEEDYDINLSGTLGLGAVRISGGRDNVVIEKNGEEPIHAESLEAVTTAMLGYAFPASELLYWVRGIPSPSRPANISRGEDGLVSRIVQEDASGIRWTMEFDRFELVQQRPLPARIRLTQSPYRLTFLISNWVLP